MRVVATVVGLLVATCEVYAGPNETCANPVVVEKAIAGEKDNTGVGQSFRTDLQRVFGQRISSAYRLSSFVVDVRKRTLRGLISDWADQMSDRELCGNSGCSGSRQDAKDKIYQFLKSHEQLPSLYDDYFMNVGPARATGYDRNIDQATCELRYQINIARIRDFMRDAKLLKEAELAEFDRMVEIQRAMPQFLTLRYAVQPDGRGGVAVDVMLRQ